MKPVMLNTDVFPYNFMIKLFGTNNIAAFHSTKISALNSIIEHNYLQSITYKV